MQLAAVKPDLARALAANPAAREIFVICPHPNPPPQAGEVLWRA